MHPKSHLLRQAWGGGSSWHSTPVLRRAMSSVTTLCQLPHESGLGASGFFPPGRPGAASQRTEHWRQPRKPRRTPWRPAEAEGSISRLKPTIEAPTVLFPAGGRPGQGHPRHGRGTAWLWGRWGATVGVLEVSWASARVPSNPCFLGDEKPSVAG